LLAHDFGSGTELSRHDYFAQHACTVFLSQSLPTYYAKIDGEHAHDRVHHLLGNFATRIWHNNACAETNEWAAKTVGRTLQQRENFSQSSGTSGSYGMNFGQGDNWDTNESSSSRFSTSMNGPSLNGSSTSGSSDGSNRNWGKNRNFSSSENVSQGYSEAMDYMIEPSAFARMLKTGGPANRNLVCAIWYQAGRRFGASDGNTLMAEFAQ
jgi:hypothetical protein